MGCTGTFWTRVTFSYHYTLSTFALLLTLAFWQFNLTILNSTKCEMGKIRCNHIDYRQSLLMAGLPKNFSDILLPDDLIWFDKCRVRGFEEMSRVECGRSSNRNRGRSNRLTRKVTFTCQSTVERLPPLHRSFTIFPTAGKPEVAISAQAYAKGGGPLHPWEGIHRAKLSSTAWQ